jgi:AcrR family transcriptional regulator
MMKQAERRAATSNAILQSAVELFGKVGFEQTSVDRIAHHAGVSKGIVFHHFESKEQLFEAVIEHYSEIVGLAVREAAKDAPDILSAIDRGTRCYFRTCADPIMNRVILQDGPAVLGWRRWREIDEKYFSWQIPRALRTAMEQGVVKRQPIEPLARVLLGALFEAAVACAESDAPEQTCEQYAQATHSLIEGLRAN